MTSSNMMNGIKTNGIKTSGGTSTGIKVNGDMIVNMPTDVKMNANLTSNATTISDPKSGIVRTNVMNSLPDFWK